MWSETEVITVELSDVPHFVSRPLGLKTVEYGPLVFSLPIETEYEKLEYTKDDVQRKFPYCDYEYLPVSDWNYAYSSDKYDVVFRDVSDIPFSSDNPPNAVASKYSSKLLIFRVRMISVANSDGKKTNCSVSS